MKFVRGWVLAAFILVGSAVPSAYAHHSGAGFNTSEVHEFKATIKEFQFTNPHTWIQVMVTNEGGQQLEWSVEWGSPNSLARRGVRPSTFPVGAEITMRINPMANGSPAGGFVGAKFSDGTTIGNLED
jgi:hypothetical protein